MSRKTIRAPTCCLTQRTFQLGLRLRRFFWIHKCFRIYSINGTVFGFKWVYTVQLIWEHSFWYKIFTLDSELKISGHTINLTHLDFRSMNPRFIDFLPHFGPCFCSNSCSKKKMYGTRQFHTPFFSGVFCTFTARCFWTITFFFTLRFTLTFSGTITFCLVAFLTVLASISFT